MATAFRQLHHICVVVHDIDKSAAYYESIGIGPWQDMPLVGFATLDVANPDAFGQLRYKLVDLDNFQLQLCQPPMLDCPQRRFLDAHGEGVFHIGFEHGVDAAVDWARDLGLNVITYGKRDNGSGFAYFDTHAHAGATLVARETLR